MTDRESARAAMVKRQLEGRDIDDGRVLQAMATVPRESFVPEDLTDLAYADRPLPIGEDQTISQPYIVALMSQLLELRPEGRVLEIGTGCGYQTAVLAELADEVYSIEVRPRLAAAAKKRLARLGYRSVHFRTGDGSEGWDEHAPFDGIVVTCASTEVPPALVQQLAGGGKLVIPVEAGGVQTLTLVTKGNDGSVTTESVCAVRFVPMVETDR